MWWHNPFSKEAAWKLLEACQGYTISHLDKGPGVIIRHDIDNDIRKSVRFAAIEREMGIRSVYYALDTADYWPSFGALDQIAKMGHEIGWHNNALTCWLESEMMADLRELVAGPISELRNAGFEIKGTSGHGSSKFTYNNHQIWGDSHWIGQPQFNLSEFGLEYEAMLTVQRDYYYSDSRKRWFGDLQWNDLLKLVNEHKETKRIILLIHPEHWQI